MTSGGPIVYTQLIKAGLAGGLQRIDNMFRSALLGALLLALLSSQAQAEVIRLRDGRLLQGKLLQHNGVEVTIERLDNGGQVTIPFKEMLPVDRKRIEEKLGYRSQEDILQKVPAVRLTLKNNPGDRPIGQLVASRTNETTVAISRRGVTYSYPRSNVAKIEQVQVPETDVLTPKQIYAARLAEIEKKETPDAREHFELAKYIQELGLFEEAKLHYQKAVEIDAVNYESLVKAPLEKLESLITNRDALKAYRGVISARASNEYAKARERLSALMEAWPSVEFPMSFDELKASIDEAEKTYLNEQTIRYIYSIARNVAYKKAREKGITADDAVAYGKGGMHADVIAELAAKLKVEENVAKALFSARETNNLQRLNVGSASFMLQGKSSGGGKKNARQGPDLQKILEQMGRGRGRNGRNGNNNQAQKKKVDPKVSWWKRADGSARRNLIYAAWVQKQCEIVKTYNEACSHCRGAGSVTVYTQNGATKEVCPRCQGTRYDIQLRYK